jgi:hypothetical protein
MATEGYTQGEYEGNAQIDREKDSVLKQGDREFLNSLPYDVRKEVVDNINRYIDQVRKDYPWSKEK